MKERLLEEELEELEGLEEEREEESTSDPTDGNMSVIENVLEFLKNSEDMYVTFSQIFKPEAATFMCAEEGS